ncbi:MAG: helicase-related protein, partial [Bdellovibrionia bacterium]
ASGKVPEQDGKDLMRDQIRKAFNSPFWPFVLVTTSIGQEGLDFHRYCADVVHWNLPSSPVDFEQREGRVQRYMGLAIREAWLKDRIWREFLPSKVLRNPWKNVLNVLLKEESANGNYKRGVAPQWIYHRGENFARIRRWILCHPFSKEAVAYRRMRDSVLLYRLALGHARQEDLVRALGSNDVFSSMENSNTRKLVRELWIDLSAPPSEERAIADEAA